MICCLVRLPLLHHCALCACRLLFPAPLIQVLHLDSIHVNLALIEQAGTRIKKRVLPVGSCRCCFRHSPPDLSDPKNDAQHDDNYDTMSVQSSLAQQRPCNKADACLLCHGSSGSLAYEGGVDGSKA